MYCRLIFWLACSTGELVLAEMHGKDSSRSTRNYRFVQKVYLQGRPLFLVLWPMRILNRQMDGRLAFFEGEGGFGNFQEISLHSRDYWKRNRARRTMREKLMEQGLSATQVLCLPFIYNFRTSVFPQKTMIHAPRNCLTPAFLLPLQYSTLDI